MVDRFAIAGRLLILAAGLLLVAGADSTEDRSAEATFMVIDPDGTALLGPDGDEIERLDPVVHAAGAISPDALWLAFAHAGQIEPGGGREYSMVVQSRADPQDRREIPLVWGASGSSFLPLWSSDSRRILICEQGWTDTGRESAWRIYDLTTKDVKKLKVPNWWWPSDWSADGKRLLMSLDGRVAWVPIDGTAGPVEFITPKLEVGYGARLSPDGKRVLCLTGLKGPSDGERRQLRLSVVDLTTGKRMIVDDPGETHGYCWSRDGSRIAYTWQRRRENPARGDVLEAFLFICDPDGGARKTVTSRRYKVPENSSSTGAIFFEVLAWR